VDSVLQVVRPEPAKIEKYTEALRALRVSCPDGVVLRKDWASVVGKFL